MRTIQVSIEGQTRRVVVEGGALGLANVTINQAVQAAAEADTARDEAEAAATAAEAARDAAIAATATKADLDFDNVTPAVFGGKDFVAADFGTAEGVERSLEDRSISELYVHALDYGLVVNVSGAAAANTTIINALIAAMGARNGGVIVLPAGEIWISGPLDNRFSGVLVTGSMLPSAHDAGTPVYGTTLVPNGAFTVLRHRSRFAAETGGVPGARMTGGGFVNMRVLGNGLATRLLEVTSISDATYELFLSGSVGTEAALFTCGVTGTDLAEACDVQRCKINLSVRQIDAGATAAHCVTFAGSTNANVSDCHEVVIKAQHDDGHVLLADCADNNTIRVGGFRVGGGTGRTVFGKANNSSNLGCYGNIFWISGGGGAYFAGTEQAGSTSGTRNTIYIDTDNGTQPPSFGTGSTGQVTGGNGFASGSDVYGGMAIAGDLFGATVARAARPAGLPLYLQNSGSGFMRFGDLAIEEQSASQLRLRSVDGTYTGVLFWTDLTTLGNLGYDPTVVAGKTFADGAAMVAAGFPIGGLWVDSGDGNTVKCRVS